MLIKTVKTRPFLPPKDDLFSLIKENFYGLRLKEKSIFVITSKIVAIWQGRCIDSKTIADKDDLVKKEADFYLDRKETPGEHIMLTIKNNLLIPTAGIDESNAKDHYILWPQKPYAAAKKIYQFIKKNYKLRKFGAIITDSHTTPLRWGTKGIAIAYYGFYPLKDYRGTEDIFGRIMKITQSNIVDALAAASVCVMGEGAERTPIAIIEDINFVEFKEFNPQAVGPIEIKREIDIYAPLLNKIRWKKGGGGF